MKKYLVITALFFGVFGFSQSKKWTLQECVNHALENNISIKQAQNVLLSNEEDIKATKGNFLPSVGAQLSHNLSIGNEQVFAGQFIDRTSNSTSVGIGVNQTIFNGFRNTNLYKQAMLTLESNEAELNRIKDNIALNVANAYLNVLFSKENMQVAQEQVDFSMKQIEQMQSLVDSGVRPKVDIYDAQATLANDEQNLTTRENAHTIALLTLSQLLQVSVEGFDVEVIDVDLPREALMYDGVNGVLDYAYQNRYEIKVAEKNIEVAELSTEISKSGFYPTVSASYSLGSGAFYTNLFDTEDTFFNQINNQKTHSFGLSVNIPIFSRFQNKTSVAKSMIQEENAKLNLEQQRLNVEANVRNAFTDAKGAFKTYEAAQKSLRLQELAFQNAQDRYDIGAMNAFDLEQARIRLINSQTSVINAKYDFVFKTKVLDFYMGKPIIN